MPEYILSPAEGPPNALASGDRVQRFGSAVVSTAS
jgi:hypothetical protein